MGGYRSGLETVSGYLGQYLVGSKLAVAGLAGHSCRSSLFVRGGTLVFSFDLYLLGLGFFGLGDG